MISMAAFFLGLIIGGCVGVVVTAVLSAEKKEFED